MSLLTWVDFGQQHREHMDRLLDTFREESTLDELGIGTIRDAFTEMLFPGTSTLRRGAGQEGLDFHHYSHAVVHWNLPSNPVDLEQREGRVHRYRGHAVRKNVARQLGGRAEVVQGRSPWQTLFALATAERAPGQSEIVPDWVYPVDGGARIDRYVPCCR